MIQCPHKHTLQKKSYETVIVNHIIVNVRITMQIRQIVKKQILDPSPAISRFFSHKDFMGI